MRANLVDAFDSVSFILVMSLSIGELEHQIFLNLACLSKNRESHVGFLCEVFEEIIDE